MRTLIAVIAPGAMGSGVARRLVERGADVITSLSGRSRASADRAGKAGMRAVEEADLARAAIILSIVPPSEAMGLAQRLAPLLKATTAKPLYIDCNAVSTATVKEIAAVIAATGAPFADAGIIGSPPRAGYGGPSIYVSGIAADRVAPLAGHGLNVKVLDAPVGAASALKMSYAAITKGTTAIVSASILSAARAGAADALRAELAASQAAVLASAARSVPDMFDKAYRFVGEMEEIGAHAGRASTAEIYRGMARLYQELADDQAAGASGDIAVLRAFFERGS